MPQMSWWDARRVRSCPARLASATLGVALLLSACSSSPSTPVGETRPSSEATSPSEPLPTPAPDPPASDTPVAMVSTSGVPTRDQALTAFELTIGDIAGYEPVRQSTPAPTEMSTVIRWFETYSDTLPPAVAQQARALFLVPAASPTVIPSGATGADQAPPASANTAVYTGSGPAEFVPMVYTVDQLRARVYAALDEIEAATGVGVSKPIRVLLNDRNVPFRRDICQASKRVEGLCPEEDADAYTRGRPGVPCVIRFNPKVHKLATAALESLVIHETWHCVQYDIYDDAAGPLPEWINEGQAAWIEGKLGPDGDFDVASRYAQWLSTPSVELFTRLYNASGFYAVLDDAGLDPLHRLARMLLLAPSNERAYDYATAGDSLNVLRRWGSTLANDATYGPFWKLDQQSMSSDRSTPRRLHIGNGETQLMPVVPYTADLARLEVDAEVIHVTVVGGGRISDKGAGGKVDTSVTDSWFCGPLDVDLCRCPNDEAADDPPTAIAATAYLARGGGTRGSVGAVEGMSVTDYCKLRRPTEPSGECSTAAWLKPGDVEPLAENWNYQPTPCSTQFEYIPGEGEPAPDHARSVIASLVVQDDLGDFHNPSPKNAVPELGPRAHFPTGFQNYFERNNLSSAAALVVFPCGRKYCVLSLYEAAGPPDPQQRIQADILNLAHIVQSRARGA